MGAHYMLCEPLLKSTDVNYFISCTTIYLQFVSNYRG